MKKPSSMAIAMILAVSAFAGGIAADDAVDAIAAQLRRDISITVDGASLTPVDTSGAPIYPITYNNILYVPADVMADALRATTAWDDTATTLTITTRVNAPDDSSMSFALAKSLENQAVYWAPTGSKMHAHSDCKSFKHGVAYVGNLEQAKAVRPDGWCGICAKGITDENYTERTAGGISDIEKCYTYSDYLAGIPELEPVE